MRRIWVAIQAFFRVLFNAQLADGVERLLHDESPPPATTPTTTTPKQTVSRPARSEALTLLAALQREARFIDFIQEPIDSYSDAQIGAAVRDVHRHASAVLQRMFALAPLLSESEGAELEVPVGFDPETYRLTGNVVGEAPYRGRLAHHGWRATQCELPQWNGRENAARVVAPAEVELK